ncbi:hypothetical protein MY11210_000982 [Beauveria gryllotalpidicola]
MEATLNHGQAGGHGGAAAAAAAAQTAAGSGDTETHGGSAAPSNGGPRCSSPDGPEYETATTNAAESLTRAAAPAVTMPPYWQNMPSRAARPRAASVQSSDSSGRPTGAILLLDHEADDDAQDRNNACWARSVEIVDYTVVNGGATSIGAFVVWNVRVETLQGSYMNIRKRYSEFDTLRYRLIKSFPNSDAAVPSLPPKSVISKFRPKFLEKRRAGLQYFLK